MQQLWLQQAKPLIKGDECALSWLEAPKVPGMHS
jgi:hypothetical protein